MRKLQAFLHVSADGYFTGPGGDLRWTRHDQDPEYKQWADENARRDSVLVFGRTLFESIQKRLDLDLVSSRIFKNVKVLLIYQPQSS